MNGEAIYKRMVNLSRQHTADNGSIELSLEGWHALCDWFVARFITHVPHRKWPGRESIDINGFAVLKPLE